MEMEPFPLPSSLTEVEALIRALYEPAPPEAIQRIQEVLHRLQKSQDGWQLAQSLLSNSDDKIKFFGALTLIVKLNTESADLTEDEAKDLLRNLIGWLIRSLEDGSGSLVIRKLCSALATYFIHFSHLWTKCIRHLLHCLDLGRSVPIEEVDAAFHVDGVLGSLEMSKLHSAIWFAASFVEDVGKTDMGSPKYNGVHARLLHNAEDVISLLARGLQPAASSANMNIVKIHEESLKCFQSWILYAQRLSGNSAILVTPLRTLVGPALKCLAHDELFETAVDVMIDILCNYSGFLTQSHYDILASLFRDEWGRRRYQALVAGDFDFESQQFGLLMLAYGDAKVQDLIDFNCVQNQLILEDLCGLLHCHGYPVGEDKIFVPALEFWSTFVETMTDDFYSDDGDEPLPKGMRYIKDVVTNCWQKIQYPPIEVFVTWDSTERAGFGDARKDVADLLQAVYTLSGGQLVAWFVDLLIRYLPSRSWAELEAAAFCLGSLSDCISNDYKSDDVLGKAFATPFFEMLGQVHGPIPIRLRQTGLLLIERYSDYFERHSEYLPSALNLLFDAVGDPVLGGPSSRSIATLCSSCRVILTGEITAFIGHYGTIYHGKAIDALAEERIVLAIASIIQALSNVGQRLEAFAQLFSFVKMDISHSLQLHDNPATLSLSEPTIRRALDSSHSQGAMSPEEMALQLSLRALRCLSSMAKGMQSVTEGPIDLDAQVAGAPQSSPYAGLQGEILSYMNQVLITFARDGEVVEIICNIFRAGFSETEPGPFVFPPELVSEFFITQTMRTPRIGLVLSTACSFVSSLSKGPSNQVTSNLSKLLPWVIDLLQALPEPESDSELTQNAFDFVHRLMAKRPEILFQLQPTSLIEFFFLYSLQVLNGKEPLPKNAAAEFWTGFISLKSEDPPVQSSITNAMEHLGPPLCQSLTHNIGGNAARSELDKLSEPIKKLVVQQVHARAWLEQALLSDDFPSPHISPEDRMTFLKKIMNLRGARTTNQVVRDFWLACRGSSFAYAS